MSRFSNCKFVLNEKQRWSIHPLWNASVVIGLLFAGSFLLCTPQRLSAQQSDEEMIQTGKEALADKAFNWYDVTEDDLHPIPVATPNQTKWDYSFLTDWWNWIVSWIPDWQFAWDFGLFSLSFSLAELIGWVLVAVILGLIGYFVARYVSKHFAQDLHHHEDAANVVVQKGVSLSDRVEALPVQVSRDVSDLLAEAKRQYEAGNYHDAIIYLYSHQLVLLDHHHLIRLTKGKTNRQYLREVVRSGKDQLGKLLENSIVTFEAAFFGNHTIDQAQFETCWSQMPEFEKRLKEATS